MNLMIAIYVISQLTANHGLFWSLGYCHHTAPYLLPWKQHISILKIAELKTHDVRLKGATSRYTHLEKFSLNFSSSSFVICVNLLHSWPPLILFFFLWSFWCFSVLVNYHFHVSFNFKVVFYAAKLTQNTMIELLLDFDISFSNAGKSFWVFFVDNYRL